MLKTITLEAARINAGYQLKDAAPLLGVDRNTLSRYEKDSSKITHNLIEKIEKLYNFPRNNIFFGVKYEFIRSIRQREEVK